MSLDAPPWYHVVPDALGTVVAQLLAQRSRLETERQPVIAWRVEINDGDGRAERLRHRPTRRAVRDGPSDVWAAEVRRRRPAALVLRGRHDLRDLGARDRLRRGASCAWTSGRRRLRRWRDQSPHRTSPRRCALTLSRSSGRRSLTGQRRRGRNYLEARRAGHVPGMKTVG